MSQQISAVIFPGWAVWAPTIQSPGAPACAVIVDLGGLGFVFWLAQHEQDCVTI
jgi:hypothetical protein